MRLTVIFTLIAALVSSCAEPVNSPAKEQTVSTVSAEDKDVSQMNICIDINGTQLTATLADTTAAEELAQRLGDEPVTVTLDEYGGFEKVGMLPWSLTASDRRTDTSPCDIMLYQGNSMTIFYDRNSWSYTRLGRIDNVTADELKSILGEGSVTITLSLAEQQ